MEVDTLHGSDSNSLNLLSHVANLVQYSELEAISMRRSTTTENPLSHGHGYDANKMPKKKLGSLSSDLHILAAASRTQQLWERLEKLGFLEEKAVIWGFISFCAHKGFKFPVGEIPRKRRSCLSLTRDFKFPPSQIPRKKRSKLLPSSLDHHDYAASSPSKNMKRKRHAAFYEEDDETHPEGVLVPKPLHKKHKRVQGLNSPSHVPETLPEAIQNKISAIGGKSLTLVIQKELFDTDVAQNNHRFSIPRNQVRADFLSQEDEIELEQRFGHNQKRLIGLSVLVLDPSLEEYILRLKKWSMGNTAVYNLVSGWRKVSEANKLKAGEIVQLWSFRYGLNKLGFALVKVER